MRIEFHITNGSEKGRQYVFDRPDRFLCGRSADAHICLADDQRVSRRHVLFEISPRSCKITDLNSMNGVIVNRVRYGGQTPLGKKITQAPEGIRQVRLKHGDNLIIGKTCIQVSIRDPNSQAPASVDKIEAKVSQITGYQIEGRIDSGGRGVVYNATKITTGQKVALKMLDPFLATDPKNVALFQQEIDLVRQLTHPHIVRLFDHEQVDGTLYFILEFVQGMTLKHFLESRGGSLSIQDALPIMLGASDGLAYAHQTKMTVQLADGKTQSVTGMVHRDLTPQHILLAHRGDLWIPKIAGFGIAKSFETTGLTDITEPDQVFGVPMYWPREQITHFRYLSPATDVFSLAAVFYEMLTGAWIRDGFKELFSMGSQQEHPATIAEYMQVIMENPPVPIQQRNSEIPDAVAKVIDQALQEAEAPYDQNKMHQMLAHLRYPDAAAFRLALVEAFESNGFVEAQGTISYSLLRPASKQEVALLVLDIKESSEYICRFGDTYFFNVIAELYKRVKRHPSEPKLIFLKTTGDGFLAVFHTMSAAFSLATDFLERPLSPDLHIRIGLHWGAVKAGPDGDVFGVEVHRVFRIEGVQESHRTELSASRAALPRDDRIVITKQGFERLSDSSKFQFQPAGRFHLKGFGEANELWMIHK